MSQPKLDRHWIKQVMYSVTYGGGFKPGIINMKRLVKPLFWEIREREQQNELMEWINKMIDKTVQETRDGQ